MKKIFAITILLCALAMGVHAQKYACVNTEYIMTNIPEYAQAQAQLEKLSAQWQKELETQFAAIDKMYKTYQQEAYLLPDNLKRKREEEIVAKEKEVKELQRKYFGNGGDLDKKRAELVKPIQEKVYSAIERISNEKSYAFVFDKAASTTLLFASSKYDISDQVLDLLGYKAAAPAEGASPASAGKESPSFPKKGLDNPEMRKP